MNLVNKLEVWLNDRKVGILAETKQKVTAFEYDSMWLAEGYSISPLSLPLEKRVFVSKMEPFDGLFGVFADSLPDGWGRLLVDRILLSENINPYEVTPIQRLAIVGDSGMGALLYHPAQSLVGERQEEDLDKLSYSCKKMLEQNYSEDLDTLFALGGSSGGARPKVLTEYEGQPWLIKFPSTYDNDNIGYEEFSYAECAKKCGIQVEETKLFESKKCLGYFGVRRFDRNPNDRNKRVHMVTVSGLLETSHRIPNLDYHTLMKLTWIMTKDYLQIEQMYRRMCFNVFSHNRDDHSKNFSFLFDEENRKWKLTPAYDMTYSNSIGGEHATCVDGNGKNPGIKELINVGISAKISRAKAEEIALEIQRTVKDCLGDFLKSD